MTKEIQMPKPENQLSRTVPSFASAWDAVDPSALFGSGRPRFGFCHWDFFRHSSFVIRHFATLLLFCTALPALSATSIDPTDRRAYGANIGWMDFRGNTNSGV